MIQSTGPILLSGPHAADLAVRTMTFSEELSAPFTYTLEVLSDKNNLEASAFLGEPMVVHLLSLEGDTQRHFSGWVSEFYMLGGIVESTLYRIVLRPWLAFLQHSSDCRVYHDMTVPEILFDVFRRHDIPDFDPKLSGDYEKREYVVQYRESDFNFVSRLMEAEGIYYFFRHLETRHELVLCDSVLEHEPAPSYSEVVYLPVGDRRRLQVEHIHNWQSRHRAVSGGVILTDYDFTAPRAVLNQDVIDPEKHTRSDHLVFDYPGGYTVPEPTGRSIAKRRLEELKSGFEGTMGESNARGLTVGSTFKLKDHPIAAQNREYLLVSMRGTLATHALESGASLDQGEPFKCQFTCTPMPKPFRPARRTPCPVIHGAQTAVVVGQAGKEIQTDPYGRVKVKFPWDRYSKGEGEECRWVRVAQVWAGSDFGAMHIPRIGQEVVVEFLEGDPDHPIITGRVYNADNMPPYKLDDNATQSGIKSRSTPGGGPNNFNEIRFEDLKGQEDLFIHAEKTQTTKVKDSQTITVGASRTVTVGAEETHTVTGKETQKFDDAREMTVKLTNTEQVGELHKATYQKGRTVEVTTADDTLNILAGSRITDIKSKYTLTVADAYKVTHKGNHEVYLNSGTAKLTNGESELTLVATKAEIVNGTARLTLDKGVVTIDGPTSITIKCGGNSIEIGPSGVTVKGAAINLNC